MFILENSKLFFGFSWKYVVSKIGKGGTHLYCVRTHPDTWFWKGGPHGNILSGTNVGIPISGKQCFQFLKLLRGKMCALPPLTFIIHVVFVVVVIIVVFTWNQEKIYILLISNFLKTSKRTSRSKRGWKRTDSTELRLVSKVKNC